MWEIQVASFILVFAISMVGIGSAIQRLASKVKEVASALEAIAKAINDTKKSP